MPMVIWDIHLSSGKSEYSCGWFKFATLLNEQDARNVSHSGQKKLFPIHRSSLRTAAARPIQPSRCSRASCMWGHDPVRNACSYPSFGFVWIMVEDNETPTENCGRREISFNELKGSTAIISKHAKIKVGQSCPCFNQPPINNMDPSLSVSYYSARPHGYSAAVLWYLTFNTSLSRMTKHGPLAGVPLEHLTDVSRLLFPMKICRLFRRPRF